MATCTFALGEYSTATSPYTTASFTPAAGDLLVAMWWGAGTSGTAPTCTSTGNTSPWVLHTSVTFTTAGNNGRGRLFVQTALANATATTVTFGDAGDQTTGNHVHIYRVTNMKRVGLDAVRQTARDDSHAAGIPQVTALTVAALAQNPTLVFVHDEGTAAAPYTAPTGWTEPTSPVGEGVSTVPTERSESASRDSGFTGTTVTWGTTSVGVYGSLVVELNADPNGPPPPKLPFIQSINHFSPI